MNVRRSVSVDKAIDGKLSSKVEIKLGWNVIHIEPHDKNGAPITPRSNAYKVIFTFSDTLNGSVIPVNLEINDDGASLLHLELKEFRANFNGKIEKPAGFIFETDSERGWIKGEINLNEQKNICGSVLEISATSFDDSFVFSSNILSGFLNNLSIINKTPLYIKRIVSKNDVGGIKVWVLGSPILKKWDGKLSYPKLNALKIHALSLRKEAINHHYNPGLVILAHIKLYELFKKIGLQAQRRNFSQVAKSITDVMNKTVPDAPNNMTFEQGFEFLLKEFRNPLSHGHLDFGQDHANIDTPSYFIAALRYLESSSHMADVLFETIMGLQNDFILKTSPSRKRN